MAEITEIEADVEVYTGVYEVRHAIEELSRKIDEMLVYIESSQAGAEIKALLIEIRVQKNNQESVKKRFYEFMTQFCETHDHQSQSPEVFTSSDEGFDELKETIERFRKEEDDAKERIVHLFHKFAKSKVSGDDVGGWTAVGGQAKGKDEWHSTDMGLKELEIRENFFTGPENCGDSSDIDTKEGSSHSSDYEVTTEEQDAVISDFEEIEEDIDMKKAMGLEGMMLALMQASKVLFKKDQDAANKSLIKWIEDFEDDTGKEWMALKKAKDQAVELGVEVCCILGDLMFRVSEREEVFEKFHEFKSALKSLTENKGSMVTERLISALEMVNGEIKKKDEVRLVKKKSSKAGSSAAAGEKTNMNESQIDKLLLKFYHEVYQLDSMLNNPGLPESKLLPPSEAVIKQYNVAVKGIDKAVKELKKKSTSIFDSEVLNFNHYWRKMVQLKINHLWRNLEESDDRRK